MKNLTCFLALLGFVIVFNNSLFANSNSISETRNTHAEFNEESSNISNNSFSKYSKNQTRQFDFATTESINELSFSESQISLFESNQTTEDDSAEYYTVKADELLDLVKSENRFIKKLDSATIISLPVGIKADVGGLEYIILIDEVNFKPEGEYFNAFMSFEIPQSGKKLAFKGLNIPFSFGGGLDGDVRLELVSPVPLTIGEGMEMVINGDKKTYVVWDCEGFKEMAVDADVLFDPSIFVPEDKDGNLLEGTMIKSHFNVNIADWNDLVVQLSIDPFQIKGIEGVGFEITDAVLDFSDYRNAPNVQFPANYLSSYFVPGNPNLWRGVYIRQAAIRLPKQLKVQEGQTSNTGSQGRISFIGTQLIIDEAGFSGTIVAENLLTLEQGQIGDWAFSLEKIGITLEAGQLTKAGFEGGIIVPVMDKESPLKYTALIDLGNKYTFNIQTTGNLNMDIWAAKVNLKPASYIEIEMLDGDFMPMACLHGQAKIEIASDGLGIGADFESLVIQSEKPYLSCQSFSLGLDGMDSKMGNFPISINDIGFRNVSDTEMGIEFSVILNLVGEGDGGFGAEAGLMLVGEMDQDRGLTSWKYSYLDLTKIVVDINGGAYKIHGSLTFFKNAETYGNGFNGQVSAEFIDIIKVDATAIFGKVDGYRYWYVDALATLPTGIPIGIFQLTSFGGGAFHYMRQLAPGESVANSEYGETVSGIVYRPDKAVYLGIKASVGMCTVGSESVFNGDATLEVTFGNGGGIRTIDFRGNAYFLVPPIPENMASMLEKVDKMANGGNEDADFQAEGSLSGSIRIFMDFPNKILHANLEVYVDIAGGLIKGVGKNNLAGWAVFHFEPGEWYIHMGSPDRPVGIDILGIIELKSYFMVGHNIPGSPPPPPEVSEILGGMDLDYMGDLNALGNGKGIAFGARLAIDTGDLNFLIFYARFAMGIGFDIMMKDYGDAQCMGREGDIGINGWYANGQSYAYITGKVGIKVTVFKKKIKVEILEMGAAAILQAKLPNPFWMRGIVGGYYSILGGMISGDCKFEAVIGEECEIVPDGSVLDNLNALEDITPVANESEVNVFTTPQAVFNMEVGKVFEMVDYDDIRKSFRITLDYFDIYRGSEKLAVNKEWNDNHTVLAIKPIDILPGEEKLIAKVQISFEERSGSIWEKVTDDGESITEYKEVEFTTGVAPTNIPLTNIEYCYPLFNQYNFYQDEYQYGYIQLIQGQDYLFDQDAWKQIGRITNYSGSVIDFDLTYKTEKNEVEYVIPNGIPNNKIHKFEIVNIPLGETAAVDANVSSTSIDVDTGTESESTISVTTQSVEGVIENELENRILTTYFRTSQYNTFKAKLNAITISEGWTRYLRAGIHELGVTVRGNELFDEHEMKWTYDYKPLIRFEAELSETKWFNDEINPLLYANYPLMNKYRIRWRQADILGVPPTKALYIRQVPYNIKLTDDDINSNSFTPTPNVGGFMYNLVHFFEYDFVDIQTDIANDYTSSTPPDSNAAALLTWVFPRIKQGDYPIDIQYVVPGRDITTTNFNLNIYNPVK
ncbi:MAG: hypothetical protein PF485_06665 [Bacteroidales bacterium]|jgi:hypothetical protein|nr:hypothetical protein [Bacteroidales bacterium]